MGVVSFSVDDKTLANSQMTDIPTLNLKRRCAILFNAAAKQFTIFFRSVSGQFVEWLLVADSPREKKAEYDSHSNIKEHLWRAVDEAGHSKHLAVTTDPQQAK